MKSLDLQPWSACQKYPEPYRSHRTFTGQFYHLSALLLISYTTHRNDDPPPPAQTGMFSNCRNVVIAGGTFTHVEQHGIKLTGLELLHKEVAPGALHNSGERFDPPKCHPNTRIAVLAKILDWVLDNAGRDALIMWLYGPAGAGKSAIAQTITEKLYGMKLLLASFFFSRTDAKRNHEKSLIATIAYEMALIISETKASIEKVVDDDPALFGRSLEAQLTTLVIEPLLQLKDAGYFIQNPSARVVVIDGLDECNNPEVQCYILEVIVGVLQQYDLPLLFLITSRPEQHITAAFNYGTLNNNTFRLALDDTFLPEEDILTFLRDSFAKIKQTHTLKAHIPSGWPDPNLIKTIVQKSSGQFIYASTLIKYVASIRHRPMDRLQEMLGVHPSPNELDTPFSELDAVYIHIFSTVSDTKAVLQIMGILIAPIKSGSPLATPVDIEEFLSLHPGDVELILAELSSVVRCEMRYGHIQLLHASLGDFLLDKNRSRQFHIAGSRQHMELALLCFKNMRKQNTSSTILRYAYRSLVEHCSKADMNNELEDLILGFPVVSACGEFVAACAQQGFSLPFINTFEVYTFLVKFLTYLNSSPFQQAERQREQHLKALDTFLKVQLDKYYQHPQLTTFIVFLDSNEAWTVYRSYKDYVRSFEEQSMHRSLAQLDTTLERLDEQGLSLHKVVDSSTFHVKGYHLAENERICNDYREILLDFLTDPLRAGRHVLNGERFASAALCCLQYVSVSQPPTFEPPRNKLQLGLIYIRLLLPKSSISEDLIKLAEGHTLWQTCTENLASDTMLAQEAISAYLARNSTTSSQTLRMANIS